MSTGISVKNVTWKVWITVPFHSCVLELEIAASTDACVSSHKTLSASTESTILI